MDSSFELSRDDIVSMLKEHHCSVVFTKVDGTERKGIFTLREDALPKKEEKPLKEGEVPATPRKVNPNIVCAWDVEKSEWRSFRIDSLKGIIAMI